MNDAVRDFEIQIEAAIEAELRRAHASGEDVTDARTRAPHPVITPSPSVPGGADGDDAWFSNDPKPTTPNIDAELDELAAASQRPMHEELIVRLALAVSGAWLFTFLLGW